MKDERKSVENENLSMELELKEVEVKEDMEEDMFAVFSTWEVIEMKKEHIDSKIDNTKILDDATNSDMFGDDDESFLLQATQSAKVQMVVKKEAKLVVSTRAVNEAEVNKPQPIKMAKLKVEPMVPNPAIAKVQAE